MTQKKDTVKINEGNSLMIAHRGLSGIEVENTDGAFIAAGERSYFGIEADVRRTADGGFIICHDADLKRISGEKSEVEKMHSAGLKVNCWTVDNPLIAKNLINMGVDYITSNILE